MPDPAPAPAPASWFSTLDAGLQEYVTKNGLADKDPLAAFTAAAQSDIGLKAHMGVPADRLLKLPEGDNPEAWKAVWQRLGAPDTPDKYDFTGVKGPNGVDADAAALNNVREIAGKLNLPQSVAQALAAELVTRDAARATAAEADRLAQSQQGLASLRQNWAQNFDANMFIASQAMKAFGLTDEQVAAVRNGPSVAGALEMWRQIGHRIGEDKFIQGAAQGQGNVPMTKGDASSKLSELKMDQEWMKRWAAGGAAENREFQRLTQMAAGVDSSGNTLG